MREQPKRLMQSLSNQHAVEWIGMVAGQRLRSGGVDGHDRKLDIACFPEQAVRLGTRYRHVAARQAVLDGDLPNRCRAEEDRGIRAED